MPARPNRQVTLTIFAGCALAIFALISAVLSWNLQRLENTNGRVSHTFDVLNELGVVQGTAFEANTSVTDYMVTGDPRYLTTYDASAAGLRDAVRELRSLTADNTSQQTRLDTLEALVAAKQVENAQVTQLRGTGDVAGAVRVLTSDQNGVNASDTRNVLAAIRDQEDTLLTERQTYAHASGVAARAIIVIGSAIAILIALIVGYGMVREVGRRRRAEDDLENFIYISPEPFVATSFDGSTLCVNPAYDQAFGYSLSDLAAAPPMSLVHPDDRARVAAVRNDLVRGALASASITCRAVCKDGSLRWTTWHAAAIPARKLILAIARDETAQRIAEKELRELNESLEPAIAERLLAAEERARQAEIAAREVIRGEEQLRIFVENTPTAVAMLDRDLRYLVASRKWSEDYDLGGDTLVGRYHYDIFPAVDQRWREIYRRCLAGATEQSEEDKFPRINGTIDYIRWEIHPWLTADGEVGGIIMLFELITERRAAALAVIETAANLLRINSELEAFTYSVSHDLKEPLRTLEAFSQFLLKDYADKLDDEGKDFLSRLALASSRMKQLIDDLLTISRIGSLDEALEPIAIDRVVAEFVDGIRITVDERNATVDVDEDMPQVFADPRRVGQIFSNLITNGIKFNQGDAPRVEVGSLVNDAGETVFFVRDNGIGIHPEYHEKIFGVFQRLHRREEFEGTGAGLAIVKRAVEALGGRIWVESALGKGTTFLFTLPVSPAGAEAIALKEAA
jgi:PAS domain S-box-containing protein